MFRKREPRPHPAIANAFAWLSEAGFRVIWVDWGGQFVKFASSNVVVSAHYHWKDEHAGISIARRWPVDEEQPYWSQVHLYELLPLRAPGVTWNDVPEDDRDLTEVFRSGAELLRAHASDLIAGDNLELLDQIIESRPRMGVPGLDYPVDEPWAASREGLWMFTDSEMPKSMETYLERSRSSDPSTRAVAALKMIVAARVDRKPDIEAGHRRLHELLADPDANVRRAAGSALGEWADRDALDQLLRLLATEDEPSPFAAAATFVVLDGSQSERERVLAALRQFADRSPAAAAQVEQLAWRLEDGGGPRLRQDWSA